MRRFTCFLLLCALSGTVLCMGGAIPPFTTIFIRTLLDDPDAATARATLGVGTGTGDMIKAVYDVSNDGFVDGNDVVYGAGWDGDVNAPSMNVVYDKIQTLPGGHDAVTLAASAEVLLGLSTQEISLDTQTATYVLAGPTAGAAAAPTFRALADDDVPDTITVSNYVLTEAINTFAEIDGVVADKALVNKADGAVWLGVHDYGGADLELPQASPAVPGVDGGIEIDFTDGTVVIQHGAAHAELAASTDVVIGKLIKSWSGTIFEPDNVNDVLTVKAINSIQYPHGVVITAVYLGVSSDTGYVLTVQNFDDFDTINAANGTIDTVTYSADTTGEIIDTTPTYATIAAGQIIMISIPSTDVDWIHFEIYYYEPAA